MASIVPAFPSLLVGQQEWQAPCQRLSLLSANRNLFISLERGEAARRNANRGAKGAMPAGWRTANRLAST
jgi:hypothetical protein